MDPTATAIDSRRARARWTRLAALGLLMAALGPLMMLVAGFAWGLEIGDELPFFAITAGVALFGAFLVWRFGGWVKLLGALAGLATGMGLFWTAFGLATPGSFFDFVPGVLVVPGVLLAIVSSIAAFVAHRRNHLSATAVAGERGWIRAVLAVVAALAVVSGILTATSRKTVADATAAALTVRQSDFEFDQPEYRVTGGSQVLVRNDDPFLHTFTVDALGIDRALTPGSEILVTIPARTGTYILYCRPHTGDPDSPSGDDMAATIRVG